MHNNYAYDAGAAAFGRALLTNDALQFLSLSTNGIGDEGAIALAEGLKGNKALRRLDLYFNQVTGESTSGRSRDHAVRLWRICAFGAASAPPPIAASAPCGRCCC